MVKYLKCMQKFEINPNSLKKLQNIFKIKKYKFNFENIF